MKKIGLFRQVENFMDATQMDRPENREIGNLNTRFHHGITAIMGLRKDESGRYGIRTLPLHIPQEEGAADGEED